MKTLIAALIFLFISVQAQAIKITVVKNGKALLDLEGETVKTGEQFVALDEEGKKKALLTIRQVKNNKAIAGIDKGQAKEGFVLEPYEKRSRSARSSKEKSSFGIMAGYNMNSMTAKPVGGSVSMSGTSYSLLGFYAMDLDRDISAKFIGGYQTLKATGSADSAICTGSTDCNVDLSYLTIEALVRYRFVKGQTMDFWGGAGLGFLFPMSKSSNVLDTSKITTNQTINVALGLDWYLKKKEFVPFQLEYAMYPNNSTSSASQIMLSAGYAWEF